MLRYAAQEQYAKAKANSSTLPDVVLLKKMQHTAELECKQNAQEIERMAGQVVAYGQYVQVGGRRRRPALRSRDHLTPPVGPPAAAACEEQQVCDG